MKRIFGKIIYLITSPFQALQKSAQKSHFKKETEKELSQEKAERNETPKDNFLKTKEIGVSWDKKRKTQEEDAKKKNEETQTLKNQETMKEKTSAIKPIEQEDGAIHLSKKEDTKLKEDQQDLQKSRQSSDTSLFPPIFFSKAEEIPLDDEKIQTIQEEEITYEVSSSLTQLLSKRQEKLKELTETYEEINQTYQETQEKDEILSLKKALEQLEKELLSLENDLMKLKEGRTLTLSLEEQILVKNLEEVQGAKEKVSSFLMENKEYQVLLDKIVELDRQSEILNQELNRKQEKIEKQNQEFENMDTQKDELEALEQQLYKALLEMDILARDLEEKANQVIQIEEKVKYQLTFVATNLALLTASIALSKKMKGFQAVAGNLLVAYFALQLGKSMVQRNPQVEVIKSYTDYRHEIENALSSLEDMKGLLHKGLKDIQNLQTDFEEQFKDLLFENKEFKEVYDAVLTIRFELEKKEELLLKEENSLHESMKVSNEKVYLVKK